MPRSRLKLHIASLFCLLLPALLLVVCFMFPCKHCLGPKKFTASSLGGLRNHQNKCEGHLRHQGEAAGHRRSAAALSKKKKSKLSDRKARLVCLWCFCLCHSHLIRIYQTEHVARTSEINAGNENVQPMDDTVDSPDPEPDGMVVDPEGRSKSASILSPNHIEEPSLPSPPPLPLPPPLTPAGRPMRNYKQPARYIDINPEPLRPLDEEPPPPTSILPRVVLIVRNRLRTATNSFNLLREYLYRPSFDPDLFVPPEDLLASHERMDSSPTSPPTPPLVHRNQSVELLMNWKDSGPSTKSDGEINRLVNEVLLDPNFNLEDLRGFRAARENRRADMADENTPFLDSFQTATVEIEVPSGSKDVPPAKFSIPGLCYRKIPAVIRAMFASPLASKYHLSPFKLFHKAPSGKEERVFCEVYDSDAYIEENDKIQHAPVPPDDPHCKREKAVAVVMLWSDATHLANFGTAKLWPIYMFLGNLSKYFRSLPNSGACQHIAYIPSLPDSFQDFAARFHKKWGTQKKDIITHCRRELMHAVWKILLDDEFIHAYEYGIVIQCADGIERRIYPRIFTYSADYPEK